MKCKNCGAKFNEKVHFCTVCGSKMEEQKSNSKIVVIISVAATLTVCVVAFLIWSLVGNLNDDNEYDPYEAADSYGSYESYESDDEYADVYSDEYIIADSDNRYITSSELAYFSDDELMLARNEIYARRGRLFNDNDIQRYFSSKSWYDGRIVPEDFDEDILSKVEKHNVEVILEEENSR